MKSSQRVPLYPSVRTLTYLLVIVLSASLVSCALLPAPPPPILKSYRLDVSISSGGAKTFDGARLFVAPVRAQPPYDSTRMVYTEEKYTVGTFVSTEWIAPPARMIERQIIDICDTIPTLSFISSGSPSVASEYRLDIELLTLRHDFTASPSEGRVDVRVQLTDLVRRVTLATETLSSSAPAPSADPQGGVIALNDALAEVLDKLKVLLQSRIP